MKIGAVSWREGLQKEKQGNSFANTLFRYHE